MRNAALCLSAILLLAACGQDGGTPAPIEEADAAPVEITPVPASDSLPALASTPTGIALWTHPTLSFNGMLIVATANGVIGYSIEDGVEVATVAGVDAHGAAVSYLGTGPAARGLMVYFDRETSAFAVYNIDNVSREFQRLDVNIPVRGKVQGFCFGRAASATPALHVVQTGKLTSYEFDAAEASITAKAGVTVDAPDNLVSCAVDSVDGAVFLASDNGDIYRFHDGEGFDTAFAKARLSMPGGLSVISSGAAADATPSVLGRIALVDQANGAIHLFDREDGHALGAVRISATDELEGVMAATVMGATGANMGGLYRSGVIALGVDGPAPSVRLIPANGLFNALMIEAGEALNPRGEILRTDEDNGLLFETGFTPQ